MMNLKFLQQQYEGEWQRRDQLQSSAGTPLAVLAILGSALVYLFQKFDSDVARLAVPFWVLVSASLVAYLVAIYMLVRSYYGYVYRRIPLPSDLRDYELKLREHLNSQAITDPTVPTTIFAGHLLSAYIDAVDRNAVNNINRGAYLHKATSATVVALVFAAMASVPFAWHSRSSPEKSQKVYITNIPPERYDRAK